MSLLALARREASSSAEAVTALLTDANFDALLTPDSGSGKTALHFAAEAGNASLLRAVLAFAERSHRADGKFPPAMVQNIRNSSTPLHGASYYGHVECVRTLLFARADILARNRNGVTPLHAAAERGFVDVVLALLSPPTSAEDDRPALYKALSLISRDSSVCAKYEVDLAKVRDSKGATPLHYAVRGGHAATVELLLSIGGPNVVNAPDSNKQTALHWAAKYTCMETCGRLLVLSGADVNSSDSAGTSLTMDAKSRRLLSGFMSETPAENGGGDKNMSSLLTTYDGDVPIRPEWLLDGTAGEVAPVGEDGDTGPGPDTGVSGETGDDKNRSAPDGAPGQRGPALVVFPEIPKGPVRQGSSSSLGSQPFVSSPQQQVVFNEAELSPEEREFAALFSHGWSPNNQLNLQRTNSVIPRHADPGGVPPTGKKPAAVHSGLLWLRQRGRLGLRTAWNIYWFELQPRVHPPGSPDGALIARLAFYRSKTDTTPDGMILLPAETYAAEPVKLKNAALRFGVYVKKGKAHMFEVDDGRDKTAWMDAINAVSSELKGKFMSEGGSGSKTGSPSGSSPSASKKGDKRSKNIKKKSSSGLFGKGKSRQAKQKEDQGRVDEPQATQAEDDRISKGRASKSPPLKKKPSKKGSKKKGKKKSETALGDDRSKMTVKTSTDAPDEKPAKAGQSPSPETNESAVTMHLLDFPDVPVSQEGSSFLKSDANSDSDSADSADINRELDGESVSSDDRRAIEEGHGSDDQFSLSDSDGGGKAFSEKRLESLVRDVALLSDSDDGFSDDSDLDEEAVRRMLENVDQMTALSEPAFLADEFSSLADKLDVDFDFPDIPS